MRAGSLGLWLFFISLFTNLLGLALPLALLQVYDRILPTASYGTAVTLFVAVVIAMVLEGFLRLVRVRASARASIIHEHRETIGLARDFLHADIVRLQALDTGARRDGFDAITQARDLGGVATRLPLFETPFALIFIGLVWFIGGWLALVPIVVLIPFSLVALRIAHLQREAALRRTRSGQSMMSHLGDMLLGFIDAKGFGYAGRLMNVIDQAMREHAEQSERYERRSSLLADLSQVASLTATVAITIWGAYLVIESSFTTGGLAACSLLGGRAVSAGLGVFVSMARYGAARAAADHVADVRRALKAPAGEAAPSAIDGEVADIELSGVEVRRSGVHVPPTSARIAAGSTVLLRGDRHASEALLMLAICGFEKLEAGIIAPRLRASFVAHRPTLFRGSIMDNLTGWDPSRVEAARACAAELGLAALIDRLPDGMRTEIGAGLVPELSAGMVKRIALVRTLIGDAPLIALHNPAVDLDVDGRRQLLRLLANRRRSTLLLTTADAAFAALASQTIRVPPAPAAGRAAA
jgi:ABC-type bacteriocin/lantibiotic exporter with double-glycine peptidase domain